MSITIIGAGLAGCEAAHQIAKAGIDVELVEMKPVVKTPAHSSDMFAELVCSNSLKSSRIENACGLLKEELRLMGSICIEAADSTCIPAGSALAVDRDLFSEYITDKIRSDRHIRVTVREMHNIPYERPVIIATGPLTTDRMMQDIADRTGAENMYFYDAAAPVIYFDSIDQNRSFKQSRYGKGTADYINCPMNKQEYLAFIRELEAADKVPVRDFESIKVFEGCMPVEVMASRGADTLRYGPMKPVGLTDPATGRQPYACVQLRQDDTEGTLYSPVGFQTRLTFAEQKRVFRMIPGLENAEFARYGVMHRNTYLNSPQILDDTYMMRSIPDVYFAGQITGVEGYVESIASGLTAGIYASMRLYGQDIKEKFPETTMIGSLAKYISSYGRSGFQPMNANFGIIPPLNVHGRISKEEKYMSYAKRSLDAIKEYRNSLKLFIC